MITFRAPEWFVDAVFNAYPWIPCQGVGRSGNRLLLWLRPIK